MTRFKVKIFMRTFHEGFVEADSVEEAIQQCNDLDSVEALTEDYTRASWDVEDIDFVKEKTYGK